MREQDGDIYAAIEDEGTGDGEGTMFLNIGPHHPATHGVLHLKVTLDGETVAGVDPDIGYIHRCEEQMCEQGTYRYQIMPYPDRWDWSGGGLCNEWAYARAAEDLADIEVPEYAQIIRTMSAELSRMLAHMLAIGAYALDVSGDFTATFMYSLTERERIQAVLEELTGQRLMFNYFRLGGVVWDIPEPRADFFELVRDFLDGLPQRLQDIHNLTTSNEIIQTRTIDTGVLPPEAAKDYGTTGPVARGSGIDYDLRRDDPYGYYEELDWEVITEPDGDNYSRFLVRLREVEESAKIVEQCIDLLGGLAGRRAHHPVERSPHDQTRRRYRDLSGCRGRERRTRDLHAFRRHGDAGAVQDSWPRVLESASPPGDGNRREAPRPDRHARQSGYDHGRSRPVAGRHR
ncbi:MAG: NADH:ubiquinone oxidoreductase 49 kD subunit 7 [Halonotius sp. J07HN6]|nr:MAG: NADH:ubiquinone oxidoreductase 49 kD subunit 7 [Halonotius sp. J07HN6]